MPEIIEIEQYRRAAEGALDREVASVQAPDSWFLKGGLTGQEVTEALVGQSFVRTRRRGKLLLLDTDGGPTLGLRFGMTGRVVLDGYAPIEKLEYFHGRTDEAWNRFGLTFTDSGALVICDPRRLGGVELDPDEGRLGPDAWSVDREDLREVLGTSTTALKARLIDQSRLAGLGNLLVDEILWRAGLDPRRAAGSLDDAQRSALALMIGEVLEDLDQRGGSHRGDLQDQRSRDGVCPLDATPLLRRTIGGRTTYSCPEHQR